MSHHVRPGSIGSKNFDAYYKGENAWDRFKKEKIKPQNPYEQGTNEHEWWDAGFNAEMEKPSG